MASSNLKKTFIFLGLTISGILICIVISFYIMLRLSVPQTDGKITIDGINSQVEIYYDAKGIPQIYAKTENDAYFALGYQHAADRMFQMDLSRRVAQGKLSELLGSVTKSIDIEQIKIGHYRIAVDAEKNLSDNNRQQLQAYTNGINKYAEICKSLPFEYRFLPVDFIQWTIIDCLALLSFQTWYSNSLMNRDSFYNKLSEKVGKEKAETLLFPYPNFAPTTVTRTNNKSSNIYKNKNIDIGYDYSFQIDINNQSNFAQSYLANKYFHNGLASYKMSEASNAWVVAPSRSQSGSAMLASDPHLELGRLPQFWYAVGIHIKEKNIDAFGITTAGLPFLVMGHNKQSAWAFTSGGNDVVDYKSIQINSDKSKYKSDDDWKNFEIVTTTHINSSLENPETITTKFSDYGVVMKEKDSTAVVMHWVGYDVDLNNAVTNAFTLIRTSSFAQFQKIVTNFGALDANYLYADSSGNIGYQLSTPIPIRNSETSMIMPKATSTPSTYAYYPLNETPHSMNPRIGWIASCNNKPDNTSKSQGFYFANRIMRIQELLNSKETFSISDMEKFQVDLTDKYMTMFVKEFSEILASIGENTKATEMFAWDGNSDSSSYNALLCVLYLDQLKKEVFADELGKLYNSVPSKWIENFTQVHTAGWFDNINTEQIENHTVIKQTAMKSAVALAGNKQWGDFQTIQMKHPLSIIPIIGSALNLSTEPTPHGGTPATLNASFSQKTSDSTFTSIAGASMRLIVDFSNLDATTIVLPAGNSGNPMSEHFLDFYEMWRTNKRWNVPISDNKIRAGSESKLLLIPEN